MKQKLEIFKYKGAPVKLHFSLLFAIPFYFFFHDDFILLPVFVLLFTLLMLFHELGHAYVCNKLNVDVCKIDVFFLMGICEHDEPYHELEDIYISWGGVLAQLVLLVIAFLFIQSYLFINNLPDLRYSGNNFINIISHVLVKLNILMIFINLVPARGMDGYLAWKIIPNLKIHSPYYNFKEKQAQKKKRKYKERNEIYKKDSEKITDEIILNMTKNKKD